MKAVFEITSGEYSGRRFTLRTPERLSVGRTSLADYAIPSDAQMSSIHFEVEIQDQAAILRDRGSRNGTFVNAQQLPNCQLNDGDEIRAGNTTFRVQIDAKPSQEVSQPPTVVDSEFAASFEPQRSSVAPLVATSPRSIDTANPPSNSFVAPAAKSSLQTSDAVIDSSFPFAAAFSDESPKVIATALEAAAWTRQPWLLDYCRQQCGHGLSAERLTLYEMFAVLAEPIDLPTVHTIATATELGALRMRIVGKLGHPALLPLLIAHFVDGDPRAAVEAGKAFERITGCNVDADEPITLPPEDGSEPDEFEVEFLDQEKLPDANLAEQFLREHGDRLKSSPRWSRGVDVAGPITREVFMSLDLAARWDAALRGVYRNELSLGPAQLLKFRSGAC